MAKSQRDILAPLSLPPHIMLTDIEQSAVNMYFAQSSPNKSGIARQLGLPTGFFNRKNVKTAIEYLATTQLSASLTVSKRCMDELSTIAFSNPQDYFDEELNFTGLQNRSAMRAVKSLSITRHHETQEITRLNVTFHDKLAALRVLVDNMKSPEVTSREDSRQLHIHLNQVLSRKDESDGASDAEAASSDVMNVDVTAISD